jgi:hypothetical protein
VALVDHRGQVNVALHRGEEAGKGVLERADEGLELLAGHVDHIRIDAQLAGIGLGGGDAEGGGGQVGAAPDDGRRLAAQLQRHRHQVGGGIAHDGLADLGAAGEHQVVEGLGADRRPHLGPAGDHGHLERVEHLGHGLGHHPGRARHDLGGLEDGPVAGRQGVGQGREEGEQRRVPGADDAHRTLGLVLHPGLGAKLVVGHEGLALLGGHPGLEVVPRMLEGGQRAQHVVHQREARMAPAEILVHGRDEGLVILDEQVDGRLDAATAGGRINGTGRDEGLFLGGQQGGQGFGGVVVCAHGLRITSLGRGMMGPGQPGGEFGIARGDGARVERGTKWPIPVGSHLSKRRKAVHRPIG